MVLRSEEPPIPLLHVSRQGVKHGRYLRGQLVAPRRNAYFGWHGSNLLDGAIVPSCSKVILYARYLWCDHFWYLSV